MTFEEYYKKMSFSSYPFRDRTAERENVELLFINPEKYELLKDSFDKYQTCIISGNRGTGKTIILKDLLNCISDDCVCSYITNYEQVSLSDNLNDYYELILKELTKSLLVYLYKNKKRIRKLSKDSKILVSFLLMKYGEQITDSQLVEQINKIQLNKVKRFINNLGKPITSFLNFGGTAIVNFGNQFLNQRFGSYFPNISSNDVISIFPDIKFDAVRDFKDIEINYSIFSKTISDIKAIVGKPVIVLFDKFDEDSRIENDADVLAGFVKDLLADNSLLMNEDIQLVISIWSIAFKNLSTIFRSSKHFVFEICWKNEYLLNVFSQRLKVYSDDKVIEWKSIFAPDTITIDDVLALANNNPRDLWDIMDRSITAQFDMDPSTNYISSEALKSGMKSFVSNFNFYEYYPKKKNARRNTNDVYSYIKHLLALDSDEFTNAELTNKASTGGSTTNYITGMMNIGLVEKTENKRPGGAVVYRIVDPKVTYAIKNGIDISLK